MAHQQVGGEFVPVSRQRERFPLVDDRVAVERHEIFQLGVQCLDLVEEMGVLFLEQPDAGRDRGFQHHALAGPHGFDHRLGHAQRADLPALRFDVDRARAIETLQRVPHAALEHLLGGLRLIGQVAQHRAAMGGERLEIEHLAAGFAQGAQQPALARAGQPADDFPAKSVRQFPEVGHHRAPVRLVAAVEPARAPADLVQHVGEGVAAGAPAPAIDERAPLARTIEVVVLQVTRDIGRHQRGADAFGFEWRGLLVERADTRPLGVVEHREIDRAGHAVRGEFVFRTDVDNLVKFGHLCYVYRRWSPHAGPCRAAFFWQFHGSCLRVSAISVQFTGKHGRP